MNISATTGFAAVFEASRTSGVQQASNTAGNSATQRASAQQAEETDVKSDEVVKQSDNSGNTGESGQRRLNLLV